MPTGRNLEQMDVVILCGGLGKRLMPVVSDRPKPMAEINGRPFLDILIRYAGSYGFRRFILCIGHMGDTIKKYYGDNPDIFEMVFSEETVPLGTAGAVKNAEALIHTDTFLVMNGDSFCQANLSEFTAFHRNNKAKLSIVLVKSENPQDCGTVKVDGRNRIISFNEKVAADVNGLNNGGIYCFEKEVLSLIQCGRSSSLEYDLFPRMVGKECYGYITRESMIDIGTPERYEEAGRRFKGTNV